jgi:hypothetical protein
MNKDDADELVKLFRKDTSSLDPKEKEMFRLLGESLKNVAEPLGEVIVMMIKADHQLRGRAQPMMPTMIGTILSAYIMRGSENMDEAITVSRNLSDAIVRMVEQCDTVLNKNGK